MILVYEDEETLIPKNTSLLIARIPLAAQTKSKTWEGYGGDSTPPTRVDEVGLIAKAVDLANLDASEDDKIRAMISQSTQDYDPSKYVNYFVNTLKCVFENDVKYESLFITKMIFYITFYVVRNR